MMQEHIFDRSEALSDCDGDYKCGTVDWILSEIDLEIKDHVLYLGRIHFHPKSISSTDTFIQTRFHPMTLSSNFDTFIQF